MKLEKPTAEKNIKMRPHQIDVLFDGLAALIFANFIFF